MSYTITDVKDLHFEMEMDRHSGGYIYIIYIKGVGKSWGYSTEAEFRRYLKVHSAHSCCGSRAINRMSDLLAAEEFTTPDALKMLIGQLNRIFVGGNVTFILNAAQKGEFERLGVLGWMDAIGKGLTIRGHRFRNFNMDNNNYLYNWCYKGRKAKADQRIGEEQIHEGDLQ